MDLVGGDFGDKSRMFRRRPRPAIGRKSFLHFVLQLQWALKSLRYGNSEPQNYHFDMNKFAGYRGFGRFYSQSGRLVMHSLM